MTHDQHSMAEMAGGVEESQVDAVQAAAAAGVHVESVVAAEMAAEGQWTPADTHAAAPAVPPGLAALEAETEE